MLYVIYKLYDRNDKKYRIRDHSFIFDSLFEGIYKATSARGSVCRGREGQSSKKEKKREQDIESKREITRERERERKKLGVMKKKGRIQRIEKSLWKPRCRYYRGGGCG